MNHDRSTVFEDIACPIENESGKTQVKKRKKICLESQYAKGGHDENSPSSNRDVDYQEYLTDGTRTIWKKPDTVEEDESQHIWWGHSNL